MSIEPTNPSSRARAPVAQWSAPVYCCHGIGFQVCPRVVCCCMPPSRAQATSIRDPDQGLLRSSGWHAEIRSARAEISLHSDAIHESILVFPYGRSKHHFYLDRSLELTVGLPPPAKPVHHQS